MKGAKDALANASKMYTLVLLLFFFSGTVVCTPQMEILRNESSTACNDYVELGGNFQSVTFQVTGNNAEYVIDAFDGPVLRYFNGDGPICGLIDTFNNCGLFTADGYTCLCEQISSTEHHLTFNTTTKTSLSAYDIYMKWPKKGDLTIFIPSSDYTIKEVKDQTCSDDDHWKDPKVYVIVLFVLGFSGAATCLAVLYFFTCTSVTTQVSWTITFVIGASLCIAVIVGLFVNNQVKDCLKEWKKACTGVGIFIGFVMLINFFILFFKFGPGCGSGGRGGSGGGKGEPTGKVDPEGGQKENGGEKSEAMPLDAAHAKKDQNSKESTPPMLPPIRGQNRATTNTTTLSDSQNNEVRRDKETNDRTKKQQHRGNKKNVEKNTPTGKTENKKHESNTSTDVTEDVVNNTSTDETEDVVNNISTDEAEDVVNNTSTDEAEDLVNNISTDKTEDDKHVYNNVNGHGLRENKVHPEQPSPRPLPPAPSLSKSSPTTHHPLPKPPGSGVVGGADPNVHVATMSSSPSGPPKSGPGKFSSLNVENPQN